MTELRKEPGQPYLQLLENLKAINNTNNGGEGGGEAYARVDAHSVTIHYPEIVKPTFYYFIYKSLHPLLKVQCKIYRKFKTKMNLNKFCSAALLNVLR